MYRNKLEFNVQIKNRYVTNTTRQTRVNIVIYNEKYEATTMIRSNQPNQLDWSDTNY